MKGCRACSITDRSIVRFFDILDTCGSGLYDLLGRVNASLAGIIAYQYVRWCRANIANRSVGFRGRILTRGGV